MSRLLIVDGHAYAYRAFHAIRGLRSPSGRPTNAIYGFIKMLSKMRSTLSPSHLIVVWDGGLSAERKAALPEYKAQRPEMPADLASQLDQMVSYLGAANTASYCRDGVEADDYIAALAQRAAREGMEVVIASSDKDFMQLVSVRIGLFNPNDKSEAIWTAEQVRNKTGVEPDQIVDWLSMVGDSVDNIPGVPGVGPKTAAELLRQFGSVDAAYARLSEVRPERLRAAMADAAEIVRRNRGLIRLRDDLPCEGSLDKLKVGAENVDELNNLFQRWGFKSMAIESPESRDGQKDLFSKAF